MWGGGGGGEVFGDNIVCGFVKQFIILFYYALNPFLSYIFMILKKPSGLLMGIDITMTVHQVGAYNAKGLWSHSLAKEH